MAKRLGKFELPNRLVKEEETATDEYAKFVAEPFESGYGHTIGNAFRRVLLSSIEGSAISMLKMDGVQHEFQSLDGIVEDVCDIVLNLKKFSHVGREEKMPANVNEGLESTNNIVWNELKYKVTLEKDYGEILEIPCYM